MTIVNYYKENKRRRRRRWFIICCQSVFRRRLRLVKKFHVLLLPCLMMFFVFVFWGTLLHRVQQHQQQQPTPDTDGRDNGIDRDVTQLRRQRNDGGGGEHRHDGKEEEDSTPSTTTTATTATTKYYIPKGVIPAAPVKVQIRNYSDDANHNIVKKAYEEYGEIIRQLLQSKNAKQILLQILSSSSSSSSSPPPQSSSEIMKNNEAISSSSREEEILDFQKRLLAMAPWLKQENGLIKGLPNDPPIVDGDTTTTRAIVVCAGDKQIAYIKNIIYQIRTVHSCTIPIRITYKDENDLSVTSRKDIVQEYERGGNGAIKIPINIQFINLSTVFHLQLASLGAGWNLKPFGVLAVRETEIMVLDADVILLRSPDSFFDNRDYQTTGTLFFHDRVFLNYLGYYDPGYLVQLLQPNLSPTAQSIIHYYQQQQQPQSHQSSSSSSSSSNSNSSSNNMDKDKYVAEHVMESGVVVINKRKRILGVLSICLLMGRQDIRDHAQSLYVYGDKEMYWIGFEIISEPYSFAKYYPGIYGGIVTNFHGTDISITPKDDVNKISDIYEHVISSSSSSSSSKNNNNNYDNNNNKHNDNYALCGRILHFDDSGIPLWSNGGYFTKEEDWKSYGIFTSSLAESPLHPLWYIDGGRWMEEDFLPKMPDNDPLGIKIYRTILNGLHIPKQKMNPHATKIIEKASIDWKETTKKNHNLVNQYWKTHPSMNVMCLLPNSRGIQRTPKNVYDNAMKAIKHYFIHNIKKTTKEYSALWDG